MSTPEQRIRDFYGFEFPEDFFRFREFLAELPKGLFEDATDMHPAHSFDVASGNPATERPENPQWEDRYYYDLPEFVTHWVAAKLDGDTNTMYNTPTASACPFHPTPEIPA